MLSTTLDCNLINLIYVLVAGTNKATKTTALLNPVNLLGMFPHQPMLAWLQLRRPWVPWVLPTDEEFLQLFEAGVAGLRCGLAPEVAARERSLEAFPHMLR